MRWCGDGLSNRLMARREIEITAAIKDSALFRGLPLVALSRLAAIAQALHLARGSHLYRAGERSRGVYTLVTGRIMLSVGTSTSNTKVVELSLIHISEPTRRTPISY